jgi:hypothetical protein
MEDVPYLTCIKEYGGKEGRENLCARGCCGVANRGYGIKTYAECLKIAEQKGYNESYIQWYGGLTNERECSLKFATQDRGCCVTDTCSYTTRGNCQGNFMKDTYCYQIPNCYVQKHFKLGCGVVDGDEQKICWFDNLGNQEECIDECDYPAFVCSINNVEGYKLKQGEKGYNWSKGQEHPTRVNSSHVIQVFGVYCKSTTCNLNDAKGSQELKWEKRELKIKPKKPSSLISGHSICYNFYTIDSEVDKEEKISFNGHYFPARSTGLQNQIIRCVNGEVILEGLGVDRKNLCFEAEGVSTYVDVNDFEKCLNPRCGGGKNEIADFIYDYFVAGWHLGGGVWSWVFAGPAKLLGGGDCSLRECEKAKFANRDESLCMWRSEVRGISQLDTACVPRYPPGTKEYCRKCRDTGDHIFNFCERPEAYALGDCNWEPYGMMEKIVYSSFYGLALFLTTFFGYLLYADLIDCVSECIGAGVGFIGCYISCVPKKVVSYTWGFVKVAVEGSGSMGYSLLRWVWEAATNVKKGKLPPPPPSNEIEKGEKVPPTIEIG